MIRLQGTGTSELWWKVTCPLSGSLRSERTFVHLVCNCSFPPRRCSRRRSRRSSASTRRGQRTGLTCRCLTSWSLRSRSTVLAWPFASLDRRPTTLPNAAVNGSQHPKPTHRLYLAKAPGRGPGVDPRCAESRTIRVVAEDPIGDPLAASKTGSERHPSKRRASPGRRNGQLRAVAGRSPGGRGRPRSCGQDGCHQGVEGRRERRRRKRVGSN